jgi:hypothetical protein
MALIYAAIDLAVQYAFGKWRHRGGGGTFALVQYLTLFLVRGTSFVCEHWYNKQVTQQDKSFNVEID